MITKPTQCASCGKTICCDPYHRAYTRHCQELSQIMAQPEVDAERLAFVMLMISVLDKHHHVIQETAA